MILENLEELKSFILKETDLRQVNVIHAMDAQGYRAMIDHGSEELADGRPIIANVPVTVTVTDARENFRKVLKTAEIIRKEIREQKAHKWVAGAIERQDGEEYTLVIRVNMPMPIS